MIDAPWGYGPSRRRLARSLRAPGADLPPPVERQAPPASAIGGLVLRDAWALFLKR